MADEVAYGTVADLAAIAQNEARLVQANMSDLTSLITVRNLAPGQNTVRFPKLTGPAAQQVTDVAAFDNSGITVNYIDITPITKTGDKQTVSDLAAHNAPQAAADIGKLQGISIVKKRNADIFALFDGFSGAVGAADAYLTIATIRQAVTKALQAGVLSDLFMVLTPLGLDQLWVDAAATNGGNNLVSDNMRDAIVAGKMPPWYGVRPFVVTSGIAESGSVKGGIFTREALGMAQAWDVKFEAQRDVSSVGTILVGSTCYAVGEIEDSWGFEVVYKV